MKKYVWVLFTIFFVSCSKNIDIWIPVSFKKDSYSLEYITTSDIVFPDYEINGKVKFVKIDNKIGLGYLFNLTVDPLDITKIPKKYLVEKKVSVNGRELTQLPTDNVSNEIQIKLYLLDKDNFEIGTVTSSNLYIFSGSNNKKNSVVLQDIIGNIDDEIASKTKRVVSEIHFVKCGNCN